jgi:hypothetical protein
MLRFWEPQKLCTYDNSLYRRASDVLREVQIAAVVSSGLPGPREAAGHH